MIERRSFGYETWSFTKTFDPPVCSRVATFWHPANYGGVAIWSGPQTPLAVTRHHHDAQRRHPGRTAPPTGHRHRRARRARRRAVRQTEPVHRSQPLADCSGGGRLPLSIRSRGRFPPDERHINQHAVKRLSGLAAATGVARSRHLPRCNPDAGVPDKERQHKFDRFATCTAWLS